MLILRYRCIHVPFRINHSYYSTNESTNASSKNVYSSTVLLPSTKMPLRLEKEKLLARDTNMNKIHENVYKWQNDAMKNRETFVLHDGPPYANGLPHMGHAINKILKDTIVRTKLLQGKRVNYVPGWDCHGLPIELKAIKQVKAALKPLEIRQKARNFAKQTIETQRSAFQSWGVIGNWEEPYKTFDKQYIKNQLQQFYNLYEKNYIYRDVKPVYWSPSSKTALAEAELEYNPNHLSTAITVKLKVLNKPGILKKYENVHLLIWTTTPWTLPGNQAVCYNKTISYSLVKNKNETYLLASDLVQSNSMLLGKEYQVLETVTSDILKDVTYCHPVYNTELKLLHSSHATSTKGTGLVHTAPAHGPEDFLVALEHNIKIKCLVDENGTYTKETGLNLEGVSVLDDGNQKIIDLLGESVVHKEDFVHSYPYDWRTKKPVILRASQQWFIDMDPIKQAAIEQVEKTSIIPQINGDKYKKNLIDQIKKRPYWCISRQRCWGVPIPVFYNKNTGEHILNRDIIEHLCKVLSNTDTDFWWKLPLETLLPAKILGQENIANIRKGDDILDIWFDSGMSWSCVLEEPKIADMYLEGVDQFTGWFQSSLITSVGLRNCAPYKTIYVHGFALDEKGVKMSKSLGNVVDPQDIMKGSKKKPPFGIDTLRWWVACHANQDTTTLVSDNVLKASSDEVQKIRSTLRFALGSLSDYKGEHVAYEDLNLIDKYMLGLLYDYHQQAQIYLNEYQFHKLSSIIINLIANEISAIYYTAIKDRLYCDEDKSQSRLGAQFVLHQLINLLTQSIAPIVPHLAEEIYSHFPKSLKTSNSFFTRSSHFSADQNWKKSKVEEIMELLLNVRKEINKQTNAGEALESKLELFINTDKFNSLKEYGSASDLCEILQVSEVLITPSYENVFKLQITKGEQYKCPRCRKFSALMPQTLCDRCYIVVEGLKTKTQIKN